VGTRVQWEGTKLAFVSVARPLDADVSTAIDAAAAYAADSSWQTTTARRRRSR
jgi:hypothetical protein